MGLRPPSSRRGVLAGALAGLGSLVLPASWLASTRTASAAQSLVVPPWDSVPDCMLSRTDRAGQGPFFIHNDERDSDIDLFRQDIRGRHNPDAEPGTEMQLHLRILGTDSVRCRTSPLAGVEVYVWHCDAQGFYSGFGEPGEQTPDQPYRFRPSGNDLDNNARFCRGASVSDVNGVVSFRSIFPGWYNGRDIHVHVMVLKRGSRGRGRGWYRNDDHLYTTQLYFDPALIDRVHKSAEPYLRRTKHAAYPGITLGDERGSSGLRMKLQLSGGVVNAQMQLVLDPGQSSV
jgi:protocatechuate 3,4-dioxygenase beta subunit